MKLVSMKLDIRRQLHKIDQIYICKLGHMTKSNMAAMS